MEIWVKILLRIVHTGCACFIIGNYVGDFIWKKRDGEYYVAIQIICGVLLFVTGLANMMLLRPTKTMKELKTFWNALVKIKFCLCVLLLPLPELFCNLVGISFSRATFNFFLIRWEISNIVGG